MYRDFIFKPAKERPSTDIIFIQYNAEQYKKRLMILIEKIMASDVNHQIYAKNKLRKMALKIIQDYAYLNGFDYHDYLQDNFIKAKREIILQANIISDYPTPCNATNWIKILNTLKHQAEHFCKNKPTSLIFNEFHYHKIYFFLDYQKSPLKHVGKKRIDKTERAFFVLHHPSNVLQRITKIYNTNFSIIHHFELLKWISAKKIFKLLTQRYNLDFNYFVNHNFVTAHNFIWTRTSHRLCTCYEYLNLIQNLFQQITTIHHYPNKTSLIHSRYAPYIKNIQDYFRKINQFKKRMKKQARYKRIRHKIEANSRLQLKFLLHCRPHSLYTFTGIYKNRNQTIKSNPVKFRRATLITKVKYHDVKITDHVWVCSNLFALQTDYMDSGTPVTFDAYIKKYTRHGNGVKEGTHDYGLYGSIGLKQAMFRKSIRYHFDTLPKVIKNIRLTNK